MDTTNNLIFVQCNLVVIVWCKNGSPKNALLCSAQDHFFCSVSSQNQTYVTFYGPDSTKHQDLWGIQAFLDLGC